MVTDKWRHQTSSKQSVIYSADIKQMVFSNMILQTMQIILEEPETETKHQVQHNTVRCYADYGLIQNISASYSHEKIGTIQKRLINYIGNTEERTADNLWTCAEITFFKFILKISTTNCHTMTSVHVHHSGAQRGTTSIVGSTTYRFIPKQKVGI